MSSELDPAVGSAVRQSRESSNRRRATMWPARLVSVLGLFAAIWGVLGTAGIIWGKVWMINGPNFPRRLDSLPQLLSFEQTGDATMNVLDLPLWVRALSAAPDLVQALMLAGAAFLLVKVLVEISDSRSFSDGVQRNLRRIAMVLVAGSITVTALDTLAIWRISVEVWAFIDRVHAAGGQTSTGLGTDVPEILWLPLALGLVAFALGWAFRDGARMEKDAEGVI